ncbi:CRISPR-associated endonuclease Cas1 [Arcticibacterium luteifluviistationis]|uniref:CRISPR-associated endonuclease Cas1 n=1 Tax=Arcticibacterium luteifluviistationis TaxID=1784714 RepID=A0A2Z4G9A2_9BACT|nr:CRISPR-associated endonuclease Cas1 [Arcticibacterium luteifluviistationis]AWV97675.1 CRISPR-associated endonuclease Cas1 [Arcticibacterium luteifluviistationis]
MQLIIDTANTTITVRNKCFYIKNAAVQKQISPLRLSSIAITTNCLLNTSAIKLAAHHQVPVLVFNNFGTIQARMTSPYFANLAMLRKKQLLFSISPQATTWIIKLLKKKSRQQVKTLKWLGRKKSSRRQEIEVAIDKMKSLEAKMEEIGSRPIANSKAVLMGIEGSISKIYFMALRVTVPPLFDFDKRSRRPALDFFNSGLNYLYGMTYSLVESGIFAKGLDPMIGIMHADQFKEPTLAFDLIEPIRPVMDRIWLGIIFQDILKKTDFIKKEQGYWLSKSGKRIVIKTFNEYTQQRVNYGGRVLRFKDHIYQEANSLGNYLLGNVELL